MHLRAASGGWWANRGEVGVCVVGRTAGGFPDRDRRPALDERDVLSTPGDPGAGRGRAPLRAVAAAARPACRGAGRGTVVRRETGRAHVCTPFTNALLVCRLLLVQTNIPTEN